MITSYTFAMIDLSLHYGKNQLRRSNPYPIQRRPLRCFRQPKHSPGKRCALHPHSDVAPRPLLAHGAQAIEGRGWLRREGIVRIRVRQADSAIVRDDEGGE